MNLAYLYQTIYLAIVTILTIPVCLTYKNRYNADFAYSNSNRSFLIVMFFVLFIGLRPQSGAFVDMMNYIVHYEILWYGEPTRFYWNTENLVFDNFYRWLGSMEVPISVFFFIVAAIYFCAAFIGIRRLFPKHTQAAYLMFLAAFSTFSYGTNGIKAGCAASVFILAISYWEKWKVCIPLMILTLGLHHSMKLPVAAFVLAYFFKNPKYFFYGWFVCLLIAVAHVSYFQEIFAGMAEDAEGYLDTTAEEFGNRKTGFRIDFVAYSVMPVLVGYYAIVKKRLAVSRTYKVLLYTYITANAVWMLCMYASFTNRIAYLSWLMYPVVLVYPFLCEDWGPRKYETFAKVMFAHLGFTLFMEVIYYA